MPLVLLAKSRARLALKTTAAVSAAAEAESALYSFMEAGLGALARRVPVDALVVALNTGRADRVVKLLDDAGLRETFADVEPILLRAAMAGGTSAGGHLDPMRPHVQRWLKSHTAELVKETVGTSRDAIRAIVHRGVDVGRHPARMAKDIRSVIGLTERDAVAVERRRDHLLSQIPADRAHARADAYANKLLKRRAQLIAQHESMLAVNQGRASLWQQLQDDGALPRAARRIWDSSLDMAVCPICRKMHNKKARIGESWKLPGGAEVNAPPGHVGCRCSELLDVP